MQRCVSRCGLRRKAARMADQSIDRCRYLGNDRSAYLWQQIGLHIGRAHGHALHRGNKRRGGFGKRPAHRFKLGGSSAHRGSDSLTLGSITKLAKPGLGVGDLCSEHGERFSKAAPLPLKSRKPVLGICKRRSILKIASNKQITTCNKAARKLNIDLIEALLQQLAARNEFVNLALGFGDRGFGGFASKQGHGRVSSSSSQIKPDTAESESGNCTHPFSSAALSS